MSWNYRILEHEIKGKKYFGIHEVYYDKDEIIAYSENAINGLFHDVEDLIQTQQLILEDISKHKEDILKFSYFPTEKTYES